MHFPWFPSPEKDLSKIHLAIFYRNFFGPQCHVGLGVNSNHTTRVLRRHHVRADDFAVNTAQDIEKTLQQLPTVTHVVIEAPWVPIPILSSLVEKFTRIEFIVRSHSQIGFLQVEPPAIKLIRDMLALQARSPNFLLAANSKKLSEFIRIAYGSPCVYLPNLYDLDRKETLQKIHDRKHKFGSSTIKIGSFGALRLLKNHTTAAASAMLIAADLGKNLEFWISTNREENPGSSGILTSLKYMFEGLPWAKLIENPWEPWHKFRRTISTMDLCIQASFTETFNITCADAVAEGVPCVTGDAIEWVPDSWIAEADNALDIAEVGVHRILEGSAKEGLDTLEAFVTRGVERWLLFLSR